jgi:D-serine deaminase-like pyridoxal phosphate-dependent protein
MGLRLEGAACFEVLADSAHSRDAVAEAGGDLSRALALIVELYDALADRDRDGFHSRSLPQFTARTLHYLCKLSAAGVRCKKV